MMNGPLFANKRAHRVLLQTCREAAGRAAPHASESQFYQILSKIDDNIKVSSSIGNQSRVEGAWDHSPGTAAVDD